ncbi:hypothetical protein SH661x_000075 [Planctomicrobium sp. SH661]|uniref:hypothetical protein n=1 Tax=Planctomicrobium sp. SH661 TaxID=3448124 RepID=UPI003F5C48B1
MDKLARLTSEDRDNLTAYLDGELDENSTRRIESILTSSSVARNDVEILARTYELLDLLPRPQVGKEFTEKTIATAKLEGYRKPVSQQVWYRWGERAVPMALWTVAFMASAACGYALTSAWIPQKDDLLLEQLPLIQNLDIYSEVDSVQFLESLAGEKQLMNEIQGATKP